MHREIDLAADQRRIDLGGEEGLAVDLAQGDVGDAIAARVDADQLDLKARMQGFEPARDRAALRARQRAAAGAELE